MNYRKEMQKWLPILFLPLGILLFSVAAYFPHIVESVYSRVLGKYAVQWLSLLTGLLPFSLAELLIFACILIIVAYLGLTIRKSLQDTTARGYLFFTFLRHLFIACSMAYFLFVVLWGLNYHRLSFAEIAGLPVSNASVQELTDVCMALSLKTNALREKVKETPSGVMQLHSSRRHALLRAGKGYATISPVYPVLQGHYGTPKGVLLSPLMSYTGITGVYFPFTAEANVNLNIPDTSLPFTTAHEMAHQRRFAREDEANYIAYLVCKHHPDEDFQYSAYFNALLYAMNALYSYDKASYQAVSATLSSKVHSDLNYLDAFWAKYEGPVEEISNSINNAYLKANNQKDGVYSYGRMVDLLIAEHRQQSGQ